MSLLLGLIFPDNSPQIFVHVTCATDTDMIHKVFDVVRETLREHALDEVFCLQETPVQGVWSETSVFGREKFVSKTFLIFRVRWVRKWWDLILFFFFKIKNNCKKKIENFSWNLTGDDVIFLWWRVIFFRSSFCLSGKKVQRKRHMRERAFKKGFEKGDDEQEILKTSKSLFGKILIVFVGQMASLSAADEEIQKVFISVWFSWMFFSSPWKWFSHSLIFFVWILLHQITEGVGNLLSGEQGNNRLDCLFFLLVFWVVGVFWSFDIFERVLTIFSFRWSRRSGKRKSSQ